MVWKKDDAGQPKGRVVVDIRALNRIVVPDAYLIPNQADILADISGCKYITVVDGALFFYQYLVNLNHRY